MDTVEDGMRNDVLLIGGWWCYCRVFCDPESIHFGWLFCYIFDCFHMRSRIGWLEQARSRIGYIVRCIAVGIGIYIGLLIVSVVVIAIVYSG